LDFIEKIVRFFFKKNDFLAQHKKSFRVQNSHNNISPMNIFPIDRVKVGAHSYGGLTLHTYNKKNKKDILVIGNYVSISSNVSFFLDEQHQTKTFCTYPLKSMISGSQSEIDALSKGSIIINDEVWIGSHCKILSGINIGKGAIIATGSVVINDVPEYSIVGGVPARIIKYRFEKNIIQRLSRLRLIDLPKHVIQRNIDIFYKEIDINSIKLIEELFEKHGTYFKK